MAYGLRVINDDSEILVDSNYVNPTFIKKVEFNTTATSTVAGSPLVHNGYVARTYSTAGLGITGNWLVLWAIPSNTQDVWYKLPQQPMYGSSNVTTLSCTVYANSSGNALTYTLPTAYIFGVDSLTIGALPSTGPALRLYSDTGQKTFDSNHLQLLPYSFSSEVEVPQPNISPYQPGSIPVLEIDVPSANPIFLLPHAQYFQASDDLYFSGFSPGIPGTDFSATSVVVKREPSTNAGKTLIKLKSLYTYYKNITPRNTFDSAFLTSGNTTQLSVLCADGDFYQAVGSGTGGGANPVFSLSSNYSSANEGTIVTITLTTSFVADDTPIFYTITGISATDLVSGGLTGAFSVVNNSATAQFIVKNDSLTEGSETFTLTLDGYNTNVSFTILDTSIAAAQYSFGAVPTVIEGGNYVIPFSATNAGGQQVSFTTIAATTGTYWNQGVWTDGALLTNSFVVPGNSTSTTNVSFTTYRDLVMDGVKTFRIQASVNGTAVATSADIFITDTSTSSITVSDTIGEITTGTMVTIAVANGYDAESPGTVSLVSNFNALFVQPGQPNSWTINSNNFSATTYLQAGSVTADTPVTLSLVRGGGNTTPIAEKTVTVVNAPASYSWATPSPINEGSTGSLQFNYSNAANSTIYFAISYGTNVNSSDVTLNTTSHTVGNTNAAGSVSVSYSVSADAVTEGTEYFTISGAGVFSQAITINDTSTTPVPAYSITANSTPWNENSTRVCNVSVQNAAGTTLALVSDNASVTSQVATIYINSNNYSTLTYWNVGNVAADVTVNMALKINGTGTTGGYNGALVATTSALVRNVIPAGTVLRYFCSGVDKYVVKADGTYNGEYSELYQANSLDCGYIPPSWALTASPTNVNEGGTTTITLTTNQSGSYDYTITGVTSADISNTLLTGSLVNTDSRVITIRADGLTESTETLTLSLDNGQASVSVTINDTSRSSVEILQSGNINGTVSTGFASTFTVEVNGSQYPAIWSYSGTLPPGLTLTPSSNTFGSYYMIYYLSGTPTTAGTYNFTVTATASTSPADTISQSFSVTIYQAYGVYYSQYCSGVDLYYRYHNGSGGYFDALYQANNIGTCGYIPPSWSLSASPTNVNEGSSTTITLTTNQSGNFAYTITGVSSADIGGTSLTGTLANGGTRVIAFTADALTEGTETLTVSLNNGQASTAVTINDTSKSVVAINRSGSTSGTAGTAFSSTFTVSVNGSQYPAIWSYSGTLPPGLSLVQSSNTFSNYYMVYTLSGTPTTAGTYNFTINGTASTSSSDSASAAYTVVIAPAPTYSLTSNVSSVNEGGSFTITLTTNQSGSFPYTITGVSSVDISSTSLTGSLSNGGTRTISLIEDAFTEGTEYFVITLDNGAASATVTINDTSKNVTSVQRNTFTGPLNSVQNAYNSVSFFHNIGGAISPSQWSYTGNLPPGMSLTQEGNPFGNYYNSYTLAGSSGGSGNYTFTLYATNSGGDSAQATFTYTVNFPAAGTTSGGQYCSGTTLYQNYHDGAGGVYATPVAYNSPTCGYVAPSYSLSNTWTSLANGSSSIFTVNSSYANGVTLTPSISGTGAGRVSVNPTSSVISGNSATNNFTVTTTTPTATIAEQSVTISVAGLSFTFTIPAYTLAATAPTVTSITMTDIAYPSDSAITGFINFSGPITANTYVNVRFSWGTISYLPNNSPTQGASPPGAYGYFGEEVTLTVGATSASFSFGPVNPESDQFNNRVSAKTVTAATGGSDRQAYVVGPAFTILGSGGGGLNQN